MKHDILIAASMPTSSPVITLLPRETRLQIDPAPLAEIYAKMGEEAAENTVMRTLEDLAVRLNALLDLRVIGAYCEMIRPAKRMANMADHVGLVEVACAARHVGNCAEHLDGVALEATLARLERAYDMAISEIWDFRAL